MSGGNVTVSVFEVNTLPSCLEALQRTDGTVLAQDWEFCTWLLVSKALSFVVIAGSLVGNLPQVWKIRRARSAEGISLLSLWLGAYMTGINLAYNVALQTPLSTYGEAPIQFSQLLLLIAATAWYSGQCDALRFAGPLSVLILGTAAMMWRLVPLAVTSVIYGSCAVVGVVGIAPQLLMNHRSKSTGQLSFVVAAMGFGGCSTRVFTTWLEVEDIAIKLSILLNWLVSSSLVLQFVLYWRNAPRAEYELVDTQINLESGTKDDEAPTVIGHECFEDRALVCND